MSKTMQLKDLTTGKTMALADLAEAEQTVAPRWLYCIVPGRNVNDGSRNARITKKMCEARQVKYMSGVELYKKKCAGILCMHFYDLVKEEE